MDINENELEDVRNVEKITTDFNESNNNISGINKSNILEIESSQSDGSKNVECREDRIKRLKEQSEIDRQRKLAEIIESQKQSQELRQKQQIERRKKIEELKLRDEERRKAVEQRRRELDEKEKEKTESLQKRNQEREARAALCVKPSSRPASTSGGLMSQSLISPRSQARMSTSIHSSGGTSSGSEKCTTRQSLDMQTAASNLIVVPDPAPHRHRHRHRRLQGPATPLMTGTTAPEGYVEIEPGKFIPASTRHIGCFLPYRGPPYRVRGVLAWAPPPAIRRSGSEAWWAPMGSPERRRQCRNRNQVRARSAHGDSRAESIHNDYDCARTRKDVSTPRAAKVRSTSRGNPTSGVMSTSAIVLHKTSAPAMQSLRPARTAPDDSLFDRLSKPRSGSQPPKTQSATATTTGVNLGKAMTSSSTVLSKSSAARNVTGSETAHDRISKPTKKPSSTPIVSKTAPSPSANVTSNNTIVVNDNEPTETTPSSTADDSPSSSKPTATKANNKNLSRSPADNPDVSSASVVSGEEINYKLKLAEQRRIAREKKEEQLEEQRRIEEEARQRAADEKRRMEEETRQLIEEEARRARLLEEERLAELETQRQLEEAERKKKEDAHRELEEKRLEKLRIAEEARLDRKRLLEKIMSRVKRPDESSSPSNEECTGVSEQASDGVTNVDDKNESSVQELSLDDNREFAKSVDDYSSKEASPQPTKMAWQFGGGDSNTSDGSPRRVDALQDAASSQAALRNNSPELLSDTVLNLPTPQFHGNNIGSTVDSTVDTAVPPVVHDSHINPIDPPLRFKSRLLQSMLGNSGRLSSSKDRIDDRDKRHSSYMESSSNSGGIGSAIADDRASDDYMLPSSDDPVMHHSRSYQADIGTLTDLVVDHDRDCAPSPSQQQQQMHRLVNGNTAAMNGDYLDTGSQDDQVPIRIPDRPNGHSEEPIDTCWSPAPPEGASSSTAITTTTTTSPSNNSDIEDPPRLGLTAISAASDSNKLELLTEPTSTCSQLGAEDSVRQLAPPLCSRALELS